jgi:predicted ATPase
MTHLEPGERLASRYLIINEIGRGGMGAVYSALDPMLDRPVALKVVTVGAGTPPTMFQHEAKLAASLDHPAIVPVYDFGRDGDRFFFVMPIVEGLTLRQMLADGPLPQIVATGVVRQVGEALAHSHARGVVHRDIKPENVMVTSGTEGPRVKVLDFGIALSASEAAAPGAPRTIVGTLDYLSPEQALGGRVDARSDVYALGALLFECCAGASPFVGKDVAELVRRIVHEKAPPLSRYCPGVDRGIDELVAMCLAKDPIDRPQTADEVVEFLTGIGARLRPYAPPVATAAARRPVEVHSTLPAAPRLVGRQTELNRVKARLAVAARNDCQLIAVGGGYGVGKSAFVSVVAEAAQEWSLRVLKGRFLGDDDDVTPYHAIADALAAFLRTTPDGANWLAKDDLLAPLVGLFPQLRDLVGKPTQGIPPRANRGETFELLSRVFSCLLARSPVLLVLEDVHTARTSVEAIRYLVRRLAAAPLAVLLTHRTGDADPEHPLFELRSALLGEPSFLDLELWSLGRSESDELVATLLPGAHVDSAVKTRLFELTEGNPLHLSELVASLREGGQLKTEFGAWKLVAGGASSPALPASMKSVVERRLQRLSPHEREVLEAGAIFGRSFTYEDISALGVATLDEGLDRLTRRGLLTREASGTQERYLFAASVIADAAREALGPSRRRALHKRFAAHLVTQGRGGEASRAAHHLMLGGDRAGALPYAVVAAKHALDASAPENVFHITELVGEPAGPLRKEDVELLMIAAQAHALVKELDRAREIAARVLDLLERSKDMGDEELEVAQVAALRLAAELAWRQRDRPTALPLAQKALELANVLDLDDEADALDPILQGLEGNGAAHEQEQEVLGERLLVQGDYLAARELLDRADAARSSRSPANAARHALKSAHLAHRLGSFDEAELVARSARAQTPPGPLAGEIDAALATIHCSRGRFEMGWSVAQTALSQLGASREEKRVRALLLRAQGDASLALGRIVEATDAYDQSGRLLDPLTEPLEHSAAIFGSADARLAAGKPDEAMRFLERAERQKLAIGDRWGLSHVHEGFARACLYKGRLADGLSHAQRAVLLAVAIADPRLTALARTRVGLTHLARGEINEARTALDLALRDAQGCGAEPEIAGALAALAAVHLDARENTSELIKAGELAKTALQQAEKLALPAVQVAALLVAIRAQTARREKRIQDAAAIAERLDNPYIKLEVDLARALVTADDAALDAVVARAAELGAGRHVAEALLEHARLWVVRGAHENATPLFMQASAVFAETGAPLRAEETLRQVL